MSYTLIGPNGNPYESATPGTLGGHKATRIYGRLDCPSALRAIANGGYVTQRVFFADEAAAFAAGYRPCARCLPDEYRTWRRRMSHGEEPFGPAGNLSATLGSVASTHQRSTGGRANVHERKDFDQR